VENGIHRTGIVLRPTRRAPGSGGYGVVRWLSTPLFPDAGLRWDVARGLYLAWDNVEDEPICWVRIGTATGDVYDAECFAHDPGAPLAVGDALSTGTSKTS
jgi:hypothetical protein